MRLFHPSTERQVAARHRLLQQALREPTASFPIESEYPLVLGAGSAAFSYCLGDEDTVIAHANLWPRLLRSGGRTLKLGLVGNVATDERFRGQGHMRTLLDELKREAERRELGALVLWSDLLEFYQKQGFASFGQERRYRFRLSRLIKAGVKAAPFYEAAGQDAAAMLKARCGNAATLERTPAEFAELLTIPALTAVASSRADGQLDCYGLVGKGADMAGVLHEWGAPTPERLLATVVAAGAAAGLSEVLMLAPAALPQDWYKTLRNHAESVEAHPVGLVWTAEASAQDMLEASFIWGLDSI